MCVKQSTGCKTVLNLVLHVLIDLRHLPESRTEKSACAGWLWSFMIFQILTRAFLSFRLCYDEPPFEEVFLRDGSIYVL